MLYGYLYCNKPTSSLSLSFQCKWTFRLLVSWLKLYIKYMGWKRIIYIICVDLLLKYLFWIIRDSKEVTKTRTVYKEALDTLNLTSLNNSTLHIYSTISKPGNWHWHNPPVLFRFQHAPISVCVCVCLHAHEHMHIAPCNFVTHVALCTHHHNQDMKLFHHTSLPPAITLWPHQPPNPIPNTWQLLTCPSSL